MVRNTLVLCPPRAVRLLTFCREIPRWSARCAKISRSPDTPLARSTAYRSSSGTLGTTTGFLPYRIVDASPVVTGSRRPPYNEYPTVTPRHQKMMTPTEEYRRMRARRQSKDTIFTISSGIDCTHSRSGYTRAPSAEEAEKEKIIGARSSELASTRDLIPICRDSYLRGSDKKCHIVGQTATLHNPSRETAVHHQTIIHAWRRFRRSLGLPWTMAELCSNRAAAWIFRKMLIGSPGTVPFQQTCSTLNLFYPSARNPPIHRTLNCRRRRMYLPERANRPPP